MNCYDHCKLCSHHQPDVHEGIQCGLTGKKPDFETTCSTIDWSIPGRDVIINSNVALLKIKKKTTYVYTLVSLLAIAFVLVLLSLFNLRSGNTMAESSMYKGSVLYRNHWAVIGLLRSVSIAIPLFCLYYLVTFYKTKKRCIAQKKKVDELLKLYNITYTFKANLKNFDNGIEYADYEIIKNNF